MLYKTISTPNIGDVIKEKSIGLFGVGIIAQFFTHALITGGVKDITLATRHSKQLEKGISVKGVNVEPIYKTEQPSTPEDIVFVTCQAGDPKKLADLKHSGLVGPKTLIIVAQNGLNPEKAIMDAFPENAIAGMIISAQIRYETEQEGNTLPNIVVPLQVKYELGLTQGEAHHIDTLAALAQFLNANGLEKVQVISQNELIEARFMKHFKNMRNLGSLHHSRTHGNTASTYQDGLNDKEAKLKADDAILELYSLYETYHRNQGTTAAPLADILAVSIKYAETTHIPTTTANYHARKPIESLTQPILELATDLGITHTDLPTIQHFDTFITKYNQLVAKEETMRRLSATN